MLKHSVSVDLMFQALADPTRRAIVDRLSRGALPVSVLAEPFDMSLSAVMQHLALLEASGLVRSGKTGRVRRCRVDPKGLQQLEHWIHERRLNWDRRFDRPGELPSRPKP